VAKIIIIIGLILSNIYFIGIIAYSWKTQEEKVKKYEEEKRRR
jgi:hypothetical protein